MASKSERGYTYHEAMAKLFPNMTLDRLEKDLCSALGLDAGWESRLHKDKDDPKRGWIELNKTDLFVYEKEEVLEEVEKFYGFEGWDVSRNESAMIMLVHKRKNTYLIAVTGGTESMVVWVEDSPIDDWEKVSALGG